MSAYEARIGLEIHIQLNTRTKAFCSCLADTADAEPNTHICPVCTGQPGALPLPNAEMVRKALRLCLALNAEINPVSYFDRKNYLYADMPGGYQVTQRDRPIGVGGFLSFPFLNDIRVLPLENIHMEEDAGRTKNTDGVRLIDWNRSGVPLLEMVTKPELRSADEAAAALQALRQLVRWLDISEGNMEKAQLRCDANVSVSPEGSGTLGAKCELKNINSIEAVRAAVSAEISRQTRELTAGIPIEQWTIEWDNDAKELRKMRSKENDVDYRYFHEPNLLPVVIPPEMVEAAKRSLPELPAAVRERFMREYGLSFEDAGLLSFTRETAAYFDALTAAYSGEPSRAANWMKNEILRILNEKGIPADQLRVTPEKLAKIIRMTEANRINISTGKSLVSICEESGEDPETTVREQGLALMRDDSALREICEKAVREHPKEAASYRAGKETLLGFFMGEVMLETRGKADAKQATAMIKKALDDQRDIVSGS